MLVTESELSLVFPRSRAVPLWIEGPHFYPMLLHVCSGTQMVINPSKTLLGELGRGLDILGAQGSGWLRH